MPARFALRITRDLESLVKKSKSTRTYSRIMKTRSEKSGKRILQEIESRSEYVLLDEIFLTRRRLEGGWLDKLYMEMICHILINYSKRTVSEF